MNKKGDLKCLGYSLIIIGGYESLDGLINQVIKEF